MFSKLFNLNISPVRVINLNDEYFYSHIAILKALGIKFLSNRTRKNQKCLFVVDFKGDVMASQVDSLSKEIDSIIGLARPGTDSVLIRLESPGGVVHGYGFGASQIERLRKAKIETIVAVDKIAASGGYMMACVADKIISAPFAIIGSIGVVMEMPNVSKFLDKIGIEYKQYTAGKYKRTVSVFTPVTQEGEDKVKEELKSTFDLFKNHILKFRKNFDEANLATGEHWYGTDALELGLVDEITTSDDYLIEKMNEYEVLKIVYLGNKSIGQRFGSFASVVFDKIFNVFLTRMLYLNT